MFPEPKQQADTVYTEDGFELRCVAGTLEVYASGEFFHDPDSPLFRAIETMAQHHPVRLVLMDLRLASFILDDRELAQLSARLSDLLAPSPCALIGLSDQVDLIELLSTDMRTRGARIRHFSGKQLARDWLARQDQLPTGRKRRLDVRHPAPDTPGRGGFGLARRLGRG